MADGGKFEDRFEDENGSIDGQDRGITLARDVEYAIQVYATKRNTAPGKNHVGGTSLAGKWSRVILDSS